MGKQKKFNAAQYFKGKAEFNPVIRNEELFTSVSILPGGYGVSSWKSPNDYIR